MMEFNILKTLKFNLNIASPVMFSQRYLKFVEADEHLTHLVNVRRSSTQLK